MKDEAVLKESFDDLGQDFEELLYIVDSDQRYLKKFASSLKKNKNNILPKTLAWVEKTLVSHEKQLENLLENLLLFKKKATVHNHSLSHLLQLIRAKKEYFDLLRTQQNVFASLITSTDWQSPSYAHSLYPQAGVQTGKITGTINDYKRDQHLNEKEFENAYLREYIDGWNKFILKVYATNSGMAAFTTILNFLRMERKIKEKILVGKSSYFEYRELLARSFPNRTIEVDESQTEHIIETIKKEKPDAIFLDSLCNAKDIPVPDLINIIKFLVNDYREEIYLVLDNTCLSVTFQPFKMLIGKTKKVHLIMFESLMKYHHFGLDRTTGGVIVAWGKDAQKLFDYRKHSGTNITDSSVYMFPIPNRKMLERRLKRFRRNALFLSSSLQDYLEHELNKHIDKIVYPLDGSFFNIGFKRKNIRTYKQLVHLVIAEAKKKNVQIVGGSSFGLDNTRIYLTSLWTKFGEPFVRISVGTESRYQMEKLADIFKSAIDKIGKSLF